jgi:hypothetical protein
MRRTQLERPGVVATRRQRGRLDVVAGGEPLIGLRKAEQHHPAILVDCVFRDAFEFFGAAARFKAFCGVSGLHRADERAQHGTHAKSPFCFPKTSRDGILFRMLKVA